MATGRLLRVRICGAFAQGGTLTPFRNALQGTPNEGYYTSQKEAVRQAVNNSVSAIAASSMPSSISMP